MPVDKRILCVAFDFDGTLVDSNPIKENGFFAVATRRRIQEQVVGAVLARLPKGNRFEISAALAAELEPDPTAAASLAGKLAADYSAHCFDAISSCAEVPGASKTLTDLGGHGLPIYVNSATPEPALVAIIDKRGLTRYFSGIHGGPTPKAENLAVIAVATGIAPAAILLVGDSDDDAEAAATFGCRFVGITLRGNSRFNRPVADTRPDLEGLAADVLGRHG